ncbi:MULTISPECIES: arylesterase [Falsihalocynthiibacter]|uniref:arylesterase n=1 Tax=Falsihalocynthiibacter TaxID=2854182 RepID=UPI0030017F5A
MFSIPRLRVAFLYGPFLSGYKLLISVILATNLISARAQAEPVVIAALGDSLTQGYGLPQEDGLVAQLQGWLDENNHDIRLINAGVSGDTTAGGRSRIEWTLTPDVDAVIVELGGNDMMRGIAPSDSRKNLTEILEVLQSRDLPVLLVGLPSANNFGPEFKAEFDDMFPALSTDFETLLYPDFFTSFRTELNDTSALTTYMQDDAIHPNAKGVAAIVEDFGPLVVELAQQTQE